MNFFISIFGALIGIMLAVGIVALIVYSKLKSFVGINNLKVLTNTIASASNFEKEEYSRPKNVKGMTKLLEEILNDFPDFNTELIFSYANLI